MSSASSPAFDPRHYTGDTALETARPSLPPRDRTRSYPLTPRLLCIYVNRSGSSRRFGLANSLDLIAGYERDQMRTRDWNPIRPRTPAEIRRECAYYRREAHAVWGFPCPLPEQPAPEPVERFL